MLHETHAVTACNCPVIDLIICAELRNDRLIDVTKLLSDSKPLDVLAMNLLHEGPESVTWKAWICYIGPVGYVWPQHTLGFKEANSGYNIYTLCTYTLHTYTVNVASTFTCPEHEHNTTHRVPALWVVPEEEEKQRCANFLMLTIINTVGRPRVWDGWSVEGTPKCFLFENPKLNQLNFLDLHS